MKKNLLLLLAFITVIGLGSAQAQCTPDPFAVGLGIPGLTPNPLTGPLPMGMEGNSYDVTITVVIPADTTIDLTPFGIPFTQTVGVNSLTVTAVNGLPMGLAFGNCDTTSCGWPGGGSGCFGITGTPTESGMFTPAVNVVINIDIPGLGPADLPAFDFGTYDLEIGGTALDPRLDAVFKLDQNAPNPFSEETIIGFQTPTSGAYSFEVLDLVGHVLHQEDFQAQSGENTIRFDGSQMAPGLYLYRLHDGEAAITHRMMIAR